MPFKRLLYVIIILVSILGVLSLQKINLETKVASGTSRNLAYELLKTSEENTKFRLRLLQQMPSLGFQNLIADWSFLQFLQYFGDTESRQILGYTSSPLYFENIVDKDPRFVLPYFYLSNSVSIYTAQPDISVDLMAQGLMKMTPTTPPRSYFVWRYKAVDELLFLGDGQAAKESYAMSIDWAMQSPDPDSEAVAQLSRRSVEFLSQSPNSKPAQISAWAQVLSGAIDEQTRELATEAIESLGGTIVVSEAGQATVQYRIEDSSQEEGLSTTQQNEPSETTSN